MKKLDNIMFYYLFSAIDYQYKRIGWYQPFDDMNCGSVYVLNFNRYEENKKIGSL